MSRNLFWIVNVCIPNLFGSWVATKGPFELIVQMVQGHPLNPAELHFKAKIPNSHMNLLSRRIGCSGKAYEFQKWQVKDSEQPVAGGLRL